MKGVLILKPLPEGVTKRIVVDLVNGVWKVRFRHLGRNDIISPIDITRVAQSVKAAHRGYLYEEKRQLRIEDKLKEDRLKEDKLRKDKLKEDKK